METRTKKYQKDVSKEKDLASLNKILAPVELDLIESFNKPEKNQFFVIGAPRAATTLIHQLLAKSNHFGYISNFIARFYEAPYFGALQARALDIYEKEQIDYASDYGRTKGWIEPHQFNYFWKKWLRYDDNHQMTGENLITENEALFLKEIHALETFFNKSLVFKSLYSGLKVKLLKEVLPSAKFIIMLRDPLYQAQSNLIARKSFFGNFEGWFSLKPKEYYELIKLNPYDQVVGQLYYILKSIENDLNSISPEDYIVVDHVNFMNNPRKILESIIKMDKPNNEVNQIDLSKIPERFENKNSKILESDEWKLLQEAVTKYFDQNKTPFKNHLAEN